MTFNSFKRLFIPRRRTEDHSPISVMWVGDDSEATLVNPDSGRAYAHISYDGCSKYYPTVVVSPWRAFQLVRQDVASLVSLLSFPRCTVELDRSRAMDDAQEAAEVALGIFEVAK